MDNISKYNIVICTGRFSINISNPIPVCGSAECGAGAGDGKNAFTSRVQATGTFKL